MISIIPQIFRHYTCTGDMMNCSQTKCTYMHVGLAMKTTVHRYGGSGVPLRRKKLHVEPHLVLATDVVPQPHIRQHTSSIQYLITILVACWPVLLALVVSVYLLI